MAAGEKPTPIEIKLHQKSRVLEISYSDGSRFELPYEFLRVYSPSAEVGGHGPGQEVLQSGKKDVDILTLEPVGSYAVQPHFSDRFFFQAEDGIRDLTVTGVQTCALPI